MSFLAGLVARTVEGSAGIRPRRASRFEREAPARRMVEPLEPAASPPSHDRAVTITAPAPAAARTAPFAEPAAPPPRAPMAAPNATPDVRTRIERIVTPVRESADHGTAPSSATPAPPIMPETLRSTPSEPALPVRSRRRRATEAAATAAARAAPERIERIETVRTTEQRLRELTVEVRRERVIEREVAQQPRTDQTVAQPELPARTDPAPRIAPITAAARVERLRPASPQPAAVAAPEPTIEVHIGRVELRATVAPPQRHAARAAAPVTGLDDYLRRRDGR